MPPSPSTRRAPLAALLLAALLAAPTILGACSADDIPRMVYESGRNMCKQADNCTVEDK